MKKLLAVVAILSMSATGYCSEAWKVAVSSHSFGTLSLSTAVVQAIPFALTHISYSTTTNSSLARMRVLNLSVDDSTSTIYMGNVNTAASLVWPIKKDGAISIDLDPISAHQTTFYFIRKEADAGWPGTVPLRYWIEYTQDK